MISLYAGRLQLVCDRADRTWHARVILGPKPEHQLESDTGTIVLQDALLAAQSVFRMAVTNLRPPGSPLMCWDCKQWCLTRNCCELLLPEAKRTGGRYAQHCEMYDPAL